MSAHLNQNTTDFKVRHRSKEINPMLNREKNGFLTDELHRAYVSSGCAINAIYMLHYSIMQHVYRINGTARSL